MIADDDRRRASRFRTMSSRLPGGWHQTGRDPVASATLRSAPTPRHVPPPPAPGPAPSDIARTVRVAGAATIPAPSPSDGHGIRDAHAPTPRTSGAPFPSRQAASATTASPARIIAAAPRVRDPKHPDEHRKHGDGDALPPFPDPIAIGALARAALLAELYADPKPGLVGPDDPGSHSDMDRRHFERSAAVLEPFFVRLAGLGAVGTPMDALRRVGLDAEAAMLDATGGVNTHRGAIFGLGLLCAAAGRHAVIGPPEPHPAVDGPAMHDPARRPSVRHHPTEPARRDPGTTEPSASASEPTRCDPTGHSSIGRRSAGRRSGERIALESGPAGSNLAEHDPAGCVPGSGPVRGKSPELAAVEHDPAEPDPAGCGPAVRGATGSDLGHVVATSWGPAIRSGPIPLRSHGTTVLRRHGVGGARAEAAAGFPTLYRIGLPALHAGRRVRPDDPVAARVHCLFALIAGVDDTNLLHRGGVTGAAFARAAARRFLDAGGVSAPDWRVGARAIHRAFVARRLSPGGCADLLAMTIFADRFGERPAPEAP